MNEPKPRYQRVDARVKASFVHGVAIVVLAAVAAACAPAETPGAPVFGAPEPSTLRLEAEPDSTVTGTVTFANTGTAQLTFEAGVEPSTAESWLSVEPSGGTVAAGASRTLTVTAICPPTAADLEAMITILGDDPNTPTRSVDVELACVVPPPVESECAELGDPATPTLRCEGDGWFVEVPWQGAAVRVDSLPFDGLSNLPPRNDEFEFEPLSTWPVTHISVVDAATDDALTTFDPPLWLGVDYDAADFEAATPLVGDGELGLGVWNVEGEEWMVAGYGVFHEGFWVADPIGSDELVLQGSPADLQPRFQITGTPEGGTAVALIAQSPATLPVSLGSLPFDMEHMVVEFDGGCSDIELDIGGDVVDAVECVSEAAGVTVRVPVQEGGSVTPLVIALPWNKVSTFIETEIPANGSAGGVTDLERRLMNFLVVDADDPTQYLSEFDPPMEFEIVYRPEDRDPTSTDVLRVNYWNEYVEQLVVLGEGFTEDCVETVGCLWGMPVAAFGFPDFDGMLFEEGEDGFGVARFFYDQWGDRMLGFGR